AALPKAAPWGLWLEHLGALATLSLRFPQRVLAVFSELAPMETVGPVGLREVKRVLTERLLELTRSPNHRRFGQVFVGPIDAARADVRRARRAPGLRGPAAHQRRAVEARRDPGRGPHRLAGAGRPRHRDRPGRARPRLARSLAPREEPRARHRAVPDVGERQP